MNKILLFVAMLLSCLGCTPQKKTSKSNTNFPSFPQERKIDINQQIAPGTCYISLKDCEIDFGENKVIGKVSQIHGYGAGFTEVFQSDQEIAVKVTDEDAQEINNLNKISCIITKVLKMNNNSYLQLIELKQH